MVFKTTVSDRIIWKYFSAVLCAAELIGECHSSLCVSAILVNLQGLPFMITKIPNFPWCSLEYSRVPALHWMCFCKQQIQVIIKWSFECPESVRQCLTKWTEIRMSGSNHLYDFKRDVCNLCFCSSAALTWIEAQMSSCILDCINFRVLRYWCQLSNKTYLTIALLWSV